MTTSLDRSRAYNLGYDMPLGDDFWCFLQQCASVDIGVFVAALEVAGPQLNAANPQGDGSQKSFCM